jgi:hypothetical protein
MATELWQTSKFSDQDLRIRLFYLALLVANVGIVPGLYMAIQIGRPRYFALGLVMALGLLLCDVFVLLSRNTGSRVRQSLDSVSFEHPVLTDWRWVPLTALLGVFTYTTFGPGLVYYLAAGSFFTVLLVRAYLVSHRGRSITPELGVLMVGTAAVLMAETFSIAYHARTFDTIFHTSLATRIANFDTLAVIADTRYDDLPVYHTAMALGIEATGLRPRAFVGAFVAVAFAVAAGGLYAALRNLTFSSRVGFVGATLLAVNTEFVHWGTQSHVQSLSFLFFVVFLLFLSKVTTDRRYFSLIVVLIVGWVMTHHFSVFMVVTLLGAPVVFSYVSAKVRGSDIGADIGITLLVYYTLLLTATAAYWVHTGIIRGPINWITEYSPGARGVESTEILIQFYSDPVELFQAALPTLIADLHYVFWLALAGLGIWTVVRSRDWYDRTVPMLVLSMLVAFVFYFPNPAWAPLRGFAAITRWPVMALPLLVPILALGIVKVRPDIRDAKRGVVALVVVFLLISVSMSASFTNPSITDMAGYNKETQSSLSAETVEATEFTMAYMDDESVIHGASLVHLYVRFQIWEETRGIEQFRFGRIKVIDGKLQSEPGLTIVQEEEFRTGGIKIALENPDSPAYEGLEDVTINTGVTDEDVEWDRGRQNLVYDNRGTVITYAPDEDADAADAEA